MNPFIVPPAFTVLLLADPPLSTVMYPPEFMVLLLAVPLQSTCMYPPEFTVLLLAVPPEETSMLPPESMVFAIAISPDPIPVELVITVPLIVAIVFFLLVFLIQKKYFPSCRSER